MWTVLVILLAWSVTSVVVAVLVGRLLHGAEKRAVGRSANVGCGEPSFAPVRRYSATG